jgi:hypothetical protein
MSHPLTQGLTAVKEHGHGVTFYRCLDHVSKTASTTVHIVLLKLEEWRQRKGYFGRKRLGKDID